jgi:hypothetical protein
VKRIRADDKAVIFQLSTRERDTLMQILQAYPVVPPAHQRVSKDLKDPHVTEYQRLLDEALAEQRAANQRHLHTWLARPERFQKTKAGYRFTLERADSEWLLQVLNDVRVGNWLRLGSPEVGELKPQNIDAKLLSAWLAMEMSGFFQMTLLEALEN